MLVKKLGEALFIKSKLYRLLYRLAPIFMLLAPLLLIIVPSITETYEFQEPILKTKIFALQPVTDQYQAELGQRMTKVSEGLLMAIVSGRINYETIVLASPNCIAPQNPELNYKSFAPFENVFYNLVHIHKRQGQIAKNIAFVCFRQIHDLNQLFYQPTATNNNIELASRLGIIRVGLVLRHSSRKEQANSPPKVYFERYTRSRIYPDVDYYQALKELLTHQQSTFKWFPCASWTDDPAIKKWGQLFVKEIYCQGRTILFGEENPHEVFMDNGVQAATLVLAGKWETSTVSTGKKDTVSPYRSLQKVIYSFIEQFSVTQSHLHSSSTIYYPLSSSQYIPIKAHLIPGIAYTLLTVIFLVIKAAYLFNRMEQNDNIQTETKIGLNSCTADLLTFPISSPPIVMIIASIYASTVEVALTNSMAYTFWGGLAFRIITGWKMDWHIWPNVRDILKLVLAGSNVVLVLYNSIFCLPLSILAIFTTNCIAFTRPKWLRIGIFASVSIMAIYCLSIGQPLLKLMPSRINSELYLLVYPLSLWMTL